MIVVDTNVLSELMRPKPSEAVTGWMAAQQRSRLFTTTITQAEVLFGLALLPEGRRRDRLMAAARETFAEDFAGRVLPFDAAAAEAFAPIASERRQQGRPIAAFDAQIAAIALSQGAALATRNVPDFMGCGLTVINPWEA